MPRIRTLPPSTEKHLQFEMGFEVDDGCGMLRTGFLILIFLVTRLPRCFRGSQILQLNVWLTF